MMAIRNSVSKGQISSRIGKTNGSGGKGATVNGGKPSRQISTVKK